MSMHKDTNQLKVGQLVQYNRPKVGWVKAKVVEVNSRDLVINVKGDSTNVKIALRHIEGPQSPIRA